MLFIQNMSMKNVSLLPMRLASHLIQEIINELSEEGNLVPNISSI